jgi:hypothetical protein
VSECDLFKGSSKLKRINALVQARGLTRIEDPEATHALREEEFF